MEYIQAGQMIRELRRRKGMSQEQLCEGLCEPPTMSKIEKGRQYPNKKLLDALLVRLQQNAELQVPVSAADFERAQLEREIVSRIANKEYDLLELAEQYKECSQAMSNHEMQFYLFTQAIHLIGINRNWEDSLEKLEAAIQMTMPKYTAGEKIISNILTSIEFSILNNIAICLWFLHQQENAVLLMEQLYNILNSYDMDREEYAKRLPMTAFNLSTWLGILKQYPNALRIAEEGIRCCIKYGKYESFGDLLYNKGFTLLCLGQKVDGEKSLRKAFMLMYACENSKSYEVFRDDITKNFGKDFWADITNDILPESWNY